MRTYIVTTRRIITPKDRHKDNKNKTNQELTFHNIMCGMVGLKNKYSGYCYRRSQTSQGDSRFCDRSTTDHQYLGTSSQCCFP